MINTAVLYPGFNILKRGEISIILTNVVMAFDRKNDVPVIPYGLQRHMCVLCIAMYTIHPARVIYAFRSFMVDRISILQPWI